MRLLEAARAEGVVRIEIEDELRREDDLAARLEAAFGLDLAVVVPEPGGLGARRRRDRCRFSSAPATSSASRGARR